MRNITDISILVVSDDPGATKVLTAVFSAMDITCLTVVGTDEVPDYDHFDLAVLATGGEMVAALHVADRIRARAQTPRPHIALVALAASPEMERAVKWGRIDALVLKPLTIAGLTAQIEMALDRRARG